MQDIEMPQSDQLASNHLSNSTIPMDISSSNDSFIKKANNKKKKKSKQEPELVVPTEVVQPHVSTDMLVDVSEPATTPRNAND
ncbi:hypothetical protein C1645_828119 [Glomus cerebriforme]|uniref:Uncharacterized protein n=1 Tax=Glomus cerebriforme TaxID=658196 RepID=A0A397SM34_9GLOM|nr:hypothetical protein C1645_828119 [Glomus cerebriforme]